jgi:hypothetical protein
MTTLRNVKKFGIELEGGWDTAPRDHRLYKGDSSVRVPGSWRVGEIVSPILTTWQEGSDFLLVNYPDHTGASCGLHVHMSFADSLGAENAYRVALLADNVAFQTGLLARLSEVAKSLKVTSKAFWERLNGENSYCRPEWSERNVRASDRYRAVNFCSYNRHGTVEIRVLPMFSKRQISARMVREVLTFTDGYLGNALARDTSAPAEAVFVAPASAAEDRADTIVREIL